MKWDENIYLKSVNEKNKFKNNQLILFSKY